MTTSLADPRRRLRDQPARHAQPARGAAAPRRRHAADLRQHQQGLRRPRRHRRSSVVDGAYLPRDPALRAHGVAEDRPLDFHTPYGCSKGAADQYVLDYARSFGVPTAVMRMSCIYGPRQMGTEDQGWVAHFLIRALRGEPITHLRRRPAGARHPRRRRRRRRLPRRLAADRPGARAGPSTSAAAPRNAVSLRQLLAHIEDAGRPRRSRPRSATGAPATSATSSPTPRAVAPARSASPTPSTGATGVARPRRLARRRRTPRRSRRRKAQPAARRRAARRRSSTRRCAC